jgi:hypothetical protein
MANNSPRNPLDWGRLVTLFDEDVRAAFTSATSLPADGAHARNESWTASEVEALANATRMAEFREMLTTSDRITGRTSARTFASTPNLSQIPRHEGEMDVALRYAMTSMPNYPVPAMSAEITRSLYEHSMEEAGMSFQNIPKFSAGGIIVGVDQATGVDQTLVHAAYIASGLDKEIGKQQDELNKARAEVRHLNERCLKLEAGIVEWRERERTAREELSRLASSAVALRIEQDALRVRAEKAEAAVANLTGAANRRRKITIRSKERKSNEQT